MRFVYRLDSGHEDDEVCRKGRYGRKKARERVEGMYFKERKDDESRIKMMLVVIHYIVLCVFS